MNTTSKAILCHIKRITRTIVCALLLGAVCLIAWRLSVCIPVWRQQGPAEIRDDGIHIPGQRRVITLDNGSEMGFRWIPAGSAFVGRTAKLFGSDYGLGRRIVFPNGFWLAERPVLFQDDRYISAYDDWESRISTNQVVSRYGVEWLDNGIVPAKKGMVLSVASWEQLFYAGLLCNPTFKFQGAGPTHKQHPDSGSGFASSYKVCPVQHSHQWSTSVNAYGLMGLEFDARAWATKPDNFRLVVENDPASEFWNSPKRELFEKSFNVPQDRVPID